jgi:hypothetical protein
LRTAISTRSPATALEGDTARDRCTRENAAMPRAGWLLIILIAAVTAVILLFDGYTGYAVLSIAVGASAAINLA